MKYLKIKLLILLLYLFTTSYGQNFPWKKYGLNPKVMTLSNGKYKEFHDMETVVQIGSVYLNTKTHKIVGFVKKDTTSKVMNMDAHTVSRWMSPDPLSEEYSSWSPYNYVMNNPIIFIDPDGKKVKFAQGVSKEFKADFSKAIKYLNKNGAGGLFASLETSKEIYYITSSEGMSSFNHKTKTIKWDSNMGMMTDNGILCSPSTVLNHEADHANKYDQDPKSYKKDKKRGTDSKYGSKEERRVITGSEQDTAKKNGETKEGEVTRTNHNGMPWETKGPTTTLGKYELIIKPKKEKNDKN